MGFLTDYDALATQAKDPAAIAAEQSQMVGLWLATKPKDLFDELRETRPIFVSPASTIVTKYADVLEVLSREEAFSVKLYAKKMDRIVPFILGMGDTPEYQHDASVLRLAIRREDLPAIQNFVTQTSRELLGEHISDGRMDIVKSLSRVVPIRLAGHYFGVAGPDEETMKRWTRSIFFDIFLNLRDTDSVREAALASGVEFRAFVDDLIIKRRDEINHGYGETPDDVLTRLIRMQSSPDASFNDARTRDNIIGIILGAIDTTSKSIAYVVDELLRRPQQLAEARSAALGDNDDLLTRYVFEALRFKPQSAALLRLCEKPYTVGKGTPRATLIKPGTLIFAAASSAMFDASYIDAPEEFRTDRDLDLDYLHFGYGRHMCFGRFISRLQIVGVVKELLRAGELQRIEGPDGEIKNEGPFPDSFVIGIKRDA